MRVLGQNNKWLQQYTRPEKWHYKNEKITTVKEIKMPVTGWERASDAVPPSSVRVRQCVTSAAAQQHVLTECCCCCCWRHSANREGQRGWRVGYGGGREGLWSTNRPLQALSLWCPLAGLSSGSPDGWWCPACMSKTFWGNKAGQGTVVRGSDGTFLAVERATRGLAAASVFGRGGEHLDLYTTLLYRGDVGFLLRKGYELRMRHEVMDGASGFWLL